VAACSSVFMSLSIFHSRDLLPGASVLMTFLMTSSERKLQTTPRDVDRLDAVPSVFGAASLTAGPLGVVNRSIKAIRRGQAGNQLAGATGGRCNFLSSLCV